MVSNAAVQPVRNRNDVYLLHRESSVQARRACLLDIISSIENNQKFSASEQQKIKETAIHDLKGLSRVLKP